MCLSPAIQSWLQRPRAWRDFLAAVRGMAWMGIIMGTSAMGWAAVTRVMRCHMGPQGHCIRYITPRFLARRRRQLRLSACVCLARRCQPARAAWPLAAVRSLGA